MLLKLARRNFSNIRTFSSARIPGRIFGNYDQINSNESSGNSSNYESSVQTDQRRFGEIEQSSGLGSSSNSSSIVFPEESLQDYSISSFKDASQSSFPVDIAEILSEPIDEQLIEIKPDGNCYLPEVQYRRLLTKAFGVGGWSLIPRGPHSIQGNVISREYALFAKGRFVSQARGHATIMGSFQNPAMCTESVRSNSLMRCCKDLGIASSLWDNSVTSQWKAKYAIRKSVTDYQGRTKNVWEKKRQSEQY
jgi:hypothetical protein